VAETKGDKDTRVFTVTATNGDVGPAYATQISGFTLQQVFGHRCSPVVTPQSALPIVLGDIATSGAASATFEVNFAGCSDAVFALSVPWNSATYHTGTLVAPVEFLKENGHWYQLSPI
jgi:endo-1,4-beta-xylanase